MINYKPYTIKKRSNQYHTKLLYWEDKPGMEKTEMQAHIFGATPEEVEEKVALFKKSQEK